VKVAALYLRKSSEDERSAADGKSTARQRENAAAFAEERGWRVAEEHVYSDDGISGAEFVNRRGLQRLLREVRQRPLPFQALVIAEPSRLGREQIETAYVLKQIVDAGVEVWGYLDGRALTMGNATDKIMFSIQAMAAESERERGRQRVRDALVRKAKAGHGTGARTYGYSNVRKGEHSERVVNEAEAAVVRRCFEMCAAGFGDQRIRNRMAEDGARPPGRKGLWSKNIIRTMVGNELYRGVATFGKMKSVDSGGSAGRRVRTDKGDWVLTDVPHLQIVSDELWARAHARREATKRHYMRSSGGKLAGQPEASLTARFMMNGIARCWSCGGSLAYMGNPAKKTKRYYCTVRASRGKAACANAHGVPVAALDDAVREAVYSMLLNDPEVLTALCDERDARLRAERESRQVVRPDAEKEIAKLEAEVARLVNAIASGSASSDAVLAAINERTAKVDALRAAARVPAPPVDRKHFLEGVRAIAPFLNPTNPSVSRQAMRKLGITRVTVRMADDGSFEFDGHADLSKLAGINSGALPSGGKPVFSPRIRPATSAAEVPGRCAPMVATAQRLMRTGHGGSSGVSGTRDSARPLPTRSMPSRRRKAG
jgi:site-specific DNA recombinase